MKLVKKSNSVELIKMLDEAKRSPHKEARKLQNAVFKELLWVAFAASSKYKKYPNYKDLLQVAEMALYKAILAFDNTKSANLFAYIYPWVKTDVRREAWKEKQYLSFNELADSCNKENSIFDELIASPEEIYLEVEQEKVILNILKNLDNNSKYILYRSLGLEGSEIESLRDIAKGMNMSHENVRQIRNKAIVKIAQIYAAM